MNVPDGSDGSGIGLGILWLDDRRIAGTRTGTCGAGNEELLTDAQFILLTLRDVVDFQQTFQSRSKY